MKTWYTFVKWGSNPAPAKGPFSTREEADEAVERFRDRHEDMAETYLSSVRMKSYPTRSEARDADIGDDNGNIIW